MSFNRCMRTLLLIGSLVGAETLLTAQQPAGQDTSAPADNTNSQSAGSKRKRTHRGPAKG